MSNYCITPRMGIIIIGLIMIISGIKLITLGCNCNCDCTDCLCECICWFQTIGIVTISAGLITIAMGVNE